jgi:hypothetical protein
MTFRTAVVFGAASLPAAGCGGSVDRVAAPPWNSSALEEAVFSRLDADGNDELSRQETAAAPGLAWGFERADADRNGVLSRAELQARFALYEASRLGLTVQDFQLTSNGRPLAAGKVRFVPEFFVAELLEPAEAEILPGGTVGPSIAGSSLPGMRPGFYRVVVEEAQPPVPAAYGSAEATTLGVEVAPAATDRASYGVIQLKIQGK